MRQGGEQRTRARKHVAGNIGYVALVALALVPPIAADTFPNNGYNTGTDGTFVTACWNDSGNVDSRIQDHIAYFNGISNLDMTMTLMSNCDGTTDFLYDNELTIENDLGKYTCTKFGGDFAVTASTADLECEQALVQTNTFEITSCYLAKHVDPDLAWQHVWCHESGHGVGLGHESDSGYCMEYVSSGLNCVESVAYSPHQIGHLQGY